MVSRSRCLRHDPVSNLFFRGFKARKQTTKLLFLILKRPTEALESYTELLTWTKSPSVTRNQAEKTINKVLDYVGSGKGGPVGVDVLERFYSATKENLKEAKNDVTTSSNIHRSVADSKL